MIAVFDASVLVYLFDETAAAPIDVATKAPVTNCGDRISHLIAELQKAKAKIIIPAPALGEVLVWGGAAAPKWLDVLSTSKHVIIAPFDAIAAVEFAAMERERRGMSRPDGVNRAKAKFDQQIVAIARVQGGTVIYSDDRHIRGMAPDGVAVIGIAELPLPQQTAQTVMAFDADGDAPE